MIRAMLRAPTAALLLVLLLAWPRPAGAQRPFEIAGGYALARDPRDQVTLKAGWIAGAAMALTPPLSAVGEASGQYATIPLVGLDADARLGMQTLMAGVRASGRIGVLTEFAQAVAGIARASGSAFGATSASRSFAVQPGVGVDYPLTPRWAARAQLDVRLLRSQPDATNGGYQIRFAAGLVYRVRPR